MPLKSMPPPSEEDVRARLGSVIRGWRKKAGLTLAGLAEAAQVDAGFLAYIETGKKMPSLMTLAKIAGALDLPVGDLFKSLPATAGNLKSRVDKQVQVLCNGCAPDHLEDVLAVLRALKDPKKSKALRDLLGA